MLRSGSVLWRLAIRVEGMGHRATIGGIDRHLGSTKTCGARLLEVVRWRGGPVRAMEVQDLEDLIVVDRPAGVRHRLGDPM